MKKILLLGATGRTGKLLLPMLANDENEVTAYVRDTAKAADLLQRNVTVAEGDVTDLDKLGSCMADKDIVIAILSGDVLAYAKNIASALKKSTVQRVIWVTGMGIHHEVPGLVGKLLDRLSRQMPEYVQAADTIADSGTDYTLIRAAHLTDGNNAEYYVQYEGEKLHANNVDRIAMARFIADLVAKEEGINQSLGVTN